MKTLLIDNYDSFIYNLKYELELAGGEVIVCRNDIPYSDLLKLTKSVDAVVISPGPGTPREAGHCIKLVKEIASEKPILGVCLGHQVIIEAFGGKVGTAKEIVHGKAATLQSFQSGLLDVLGAKITVARYHSLAAIELTNDLRVDAITSDDEVMAISHIEHHVFGLQFHPESIMTRDGTKILNNFIDLALNKKIKKEGVSYAEFA
ncbi:aminodeoxychorismate/anthranilate synthase component II [Kangiella marina]|uniref:Aminodeoxychorismate/anthranilate synthase component II n=1 Tax=Kangiella marina TaxID=1079178 RepID=A0ABP8IPA1_9GAMM